MNRNTIIRVEIPMALYESVKGKVLNEAKKKPSAGLTKKAKSVIAKKAKAGEDIGKKGKGFEKVAAKAAKEYGSKEKGEKVAAAAMWKAQAAKKKVSEGAFSSIKKALSFDKQYLSKQDVTNAINGLSKEFKHLKFSSGDRGGIKVSNGPMSYIYGIENFEPSKQVAIIAVYDDTYRKVSTIESDSDSLLSKVKKDIQSRFGK